MERMGGRVGVGGGARRRRAGEGAVETAQRYAGGGRAGGLLTVAGERVGACARRAEKNRHNL